MYKGRKAQCGMRMYLVAAVREGFRPAGAHTVSAIGCHGIVIDVGVVEAGTIRRITAST